MSNESCKFASTAEWEDRLNTLIRSRGGKITPAEFQKIVNVVFHDVEAASYDRLHLEMWHSLAPVFGLLADRVAFHFSSARDIVLTDVGCGTGLATEMLLKEMDCGKFKQLTMVDTSGEMLSRCKDRARGWQVPAEFHCGMIADLPTASTDIVVTSSVLHHIPDIPAFCGEITRILRAGGIFCHLQDPRMESAQDPVLNGNCASLHDHREELRLKWLQKPRMLRLARSAWIRFTRYRQDSYLREVNRRLIRSGVVRQALSASEIWSVTDCHIGGLPYSADDGISTDLLKSSLPGFALDKRYTYGFFGELEYNLPNSFREEEKEMFATGSQSGLYLAAVWVKDGELPFAENS
ncbi:MAG: class I SAM-dependent methyltransferase [Verrucomicrobiota bacterium]